MNKVQKTKGPTAGAEIITKLIKGAESACKDYIALSGRALPSQAPESFIQAGAARALKRTKKTTIVLEEAVATTYKAAQPYKTGRSKKYVSGGRYDIVAYWDGGLPRAAIEVKSPLNALVHAKFEKDFSRLRDTISGHEDASFQFGIYLFLTVKKGKQKEVKIAKDKIKNLVDNLKAKALHICEKKSSNRRINVSIKAGKYFSIETANESGVWRISALVFKRGAAIKSST